MSRPVLFVALFVLASSESIHDNFLNFKGVDSVSWSEARHSITTGQPYDGVASKGAMIDVKAGRHGSQGPATDFQEGVDFDVHVMGLGAHASRPQDLNFATFGTLTFQFPSGAKKSCENIRLGQGHAGASNNWWLASKNCMMVSDNEFACEECGVAFSRGSNDHEFQVHEVKGDGVQDNFVEFPGAQSVDWRETKHSVTSGQSYDGVFSHNTVVDIKAGRDSSPGPASDFFSGLDFDVHVLGLSSPRDSKPEQLHFESEGTLAVKFPSGITRTCENIRLGQGRQGLRNNWWIGSKSCSKVGKNEFACEDCGVMFSPGDKDNSFKVSEIKGTNSAHYGDPRDGCQGDEQHMQVPGLHGTFCSPVCDLSANCPADVGHGVTATPTCNVPSPTGEKRCSLHCTPWLGQCGKGGMCNSMGGIGVCTYDWENNAATTKIVV